MAEVKVVLIVMDVLLVMHRLVILRLDLWSLNAGPRQPAVIHSPTSETVATSKSATELPLNDDKLNLIHPKTYSHQGERKRLVGSQSQCSSWSCDQRTCYGGEIVDLTQWFVVVVVCAGSSMLALLPVAMVGGPTHAGLALSRLVLPCIPPTTLPASGSTDHPRDVDSQRASADLQRRHLDFELRQLLALRQLHGTINSHTLTQPSQDTGALLFVMYICCVVAKY